MANDQKSQIPAWQQAHGDSTSEAEEPRDSEQNNDPDSSEEREATLDQARRFLTDEAVRTASVEKKTEFLKSKGFSAEQIQALLGDLEEVEESATPPEGQPAGQPGGQPEPPTTSPTSPTASSAQPPPTSGNNNENNDSSGSSNVAPIITYPEFLATSPRPPPLITPSRLLNILSVAGGAWTLLYGTARYAVGPSVAELNDARSEYHSHVASKLGELVGRLEGVVSEVPYSKDKDGKTVFHNSGNNNKLRNSAADATGAQDDAESTVSDPTELFHRDVGTQTASPPPSSLSPFQYSSGSSDAGPAKEKSAIETQESRLAALRASVQEIGDIYTKRTSDATDLGDALRAVRDDVDSMILRPSSMPAFSSADLSSLYTGQTNQGGQQKQSGDGVDEFRRTKDTIRSVKGMFLSTRSFPAVAAR